MYILDVYYIYIHTFEMFTTVFICCRPAISYIRDVYYRDVYYIHINISCTQDIRRKQEEHEELTKTLQQQFQVV